MPKRLLDFDPESGLATFHAFDPHTNRNIITYEQETDHLVEAASALRKDDAYTRKGMKESFVHYAYLPDVVLLKMKFEDGIDPFDPNNNRKVFELVDSKYPKLKTTSIVHRPKT